MALLARMLCRCWGCLAPSPGRRERATEETGAGEPGEVSSDDLTVIGGIGIATQNRLYRAGIKSYAELARALPEDVRGILGKVSRNADVEDWIAQAGRTEQSAD